MGECRLYGDSLQDFEVGGYDLLSHCRETWQGGGLFVYVSSLLCTNKVADSMKVNAVESIWQCTQIYQVKGMD